MCERPSSYWFTGVGAPVCVFPCISCDDVCTAGTCLWQERRHIGIKGGDRAGVCCVVVFENWVSVILCMVLYIVGLRTS